MDLAGLLAATFGLACLGVLWFQRLHRGRWNPVPRSWPWLFLGAGAFSIVPGLVLYAVASAFGLNPTDDRWGTVVFTWTVNAPVEESAKYLCFAIAVLGLRSIREPHDGSLQGALVGAGFGLVENVLYGLAGGLELFALRTLLSLPGHAIYGAVWGGYHGFEVYQGGGRLQRPWVPLLSLVPAMFAHALFNTLATLELSLPIVLLGDAAILTLGVFLFVGLRAAAPSYRQRPLREWRQAIPELEHALTLDPDSPRLRRHLAAYHLAARQPTRALDVLSTLTDSPWTTFYRDAARRQLAPTSAPVPASAALAPDLFRALSGD